MDKDYSVVPVRYAHIKENGTCHESCPYLSSHITKKDIIIVNGKQQKVENCKRYVCWLADTEGLDILSCRNADLEPIATCVDETEY